jgi:hypothetical protein
LKIFTLGAHGYVGPHIIAALGMHPGTDHAQVLIPARSKVDAVLCATSRGIATAAHDPQLCEVTDPDLAHALKGVLEPGQVYAVGPPAPSTMVLRIDDVDNITVLGLLLRVPPVEPVEDAATGSVHLVVAAGSRSHHLRFSPNHPTPASPATTSAWAWLWRLGITWLLMMGGMLLVSWLGGPWWLTPVVGGTVFAGAVGLLMMGGCR